MDEANKFVWAYMLEQGMLTNGEWSYYGGSWEPVNGRYSYRSQDREDKQALLDNVKAVGIDWNKTGIPESSEQSEFTDSESPSNTVEALLGKLVLNDGTSYTLGVSNAEHRFSSYVQTLAQLASDRQRVKDILGE